ncbi:hypothetical protein FHL15_009040 [Xylaria flabelliformis]|uniref:Uncharacterized protein n=1 Tax=Xylaria flabelliformis TaxID=2512241 RepID=A0A553HQ88_9PEZI|nr:hypothetical protein FHL15_009040 [Xylaria flabelliformis]
MGAGDDELADEVAVELDADAVLAFRRGANWHRNDVGFRVVVWKEIFVEICLDGARTAHGCRASDENGEEYGQLAPRAKAFWSWRPLLPMVAKRAAAAAVVVGVNMVSSNTSVQLQDLRI